MVRKKVFGGNWKMQVTTIRKSVEITESFIKNIPKDYFSKMDIFICPSFTALASVIETVKGSNLKVCAQNMHFEPSGAFTGEISIESIKELGCEYVLLGHSERRRIFGEKDEFINKKIHTALQNGVKVVLCIGETAKEREEGKIKEVNSSQLAGSLKGVTEDQLTDIIIAYEPVWAINSPALNPGVTIRAATSKEAQDAHKIVREWFSTNYSKASAETIRIQYGGSMNKKNIDELLKIDEIDGGLIGSASLKIDDFLPILKSAL
jgi:triosephosphate isomerase